MLYSAKKIAKLSAEKMLQDNAREQSEHCQVTLRSYYFCCDRIRQSAVFNWRTDGDPQKHIVSQRSLPVVHFFRRCFLHL